jgi:hypothetical protein
MTVLNADHLAGVSHVIVDEVLRLSLFMGPPLTEQ